MKGVSKVSIELVNVSKQYEKDFKAVDDLSIVFNDKQLTVLIGPSGCGKTTTMKMINRLIERTSGDILINGKSIDELDTIKLRRSIGYVIQEIGLFPHMTIYDNIAVVPRLLKWSESKIGKRVDELLDLVNLDPSENKNKYPVQLSGGQRQRVGVARGLAADPDILLMDEPFGAIDPINREKLQDAFLQIQEQIKKTIVFVTHDIREAIKLGDKIAILNKGKLVQYAEPINIMNEPENEFVENLLGSDRTLKSLELIRVKEYMLKNFFSVDYFPGRKTGDVLNLLEKADKKYAFVDDEKNRLIGYVLTEKLRKANKESDIKSYILPTESIQPYSTLMEATILMMSSGLSTVPVVNSKDVVLGIIKFKELLNIMGTINFSEE